MARHVVILAGGSGTRLWPRSREKSPKHLLTLHGRQSLLQSTLERVSRLTANVYVVTEQSQVKSIREQLPELPDERFIIEPASATDRPAILVRGADHDHPRHRFLLDERRQKVRLEPGIGCDRRRGVVP